MDTIDTSELDLDGALRKYAGHKGWYTRSAKKIVNLLGVLKQSYSWELANELKGQFDLGERQISYMSQVTDWLAQEKYELTANHRTEVTDYEKVMDKH